MSKAPLLYVDADACPVKEEVYRVARRYGLKVFLVANAWVRPPPDRLPDGAPMAEAVTVDQGPDVADDWIAQRCGPRDVVVTSDIPLAGRCLAAGAAVLKPNGRAFDAASIGMALASREVAEHLRSFGQTTSGPPPFTPADRSRFLQALDTAVVKARRTP